MGPGAPKTPKKGWNCIGFIRPGASGPRGTKKREKLRKPSKTFCVFDGNSDFYAKSWKLLENHHFALSRNVGIPCRFLMIFQGILSVFKVSRCFYQNERNFTIFSISGAQKWLFGPGSVFREPGSETFINTSFWEVFWRPGIAKVRFWPKKSGISLQNRISVKKAFYAQKAGILRKCKKAHETLPFLL